MNKFKKKWNHFQCDCFDRAILFTDQRFMSPLYPSRFSISLWKPQYFLFRDHVSNLVYTPWTWPLYHLPNLSIVSHAKDMHTGECRWLFSGHAKTWVGEQQKDLVNFFFFLHGRFTHENSPPKRLFMAESWPISQLRMDWHIRCGQDGRNVNRCRVCFFFFACKVAFVRILIHQHQQLCWTGKHTCCDVCFCSRSVLVSVCLYFLKYLWAFLVFTKTPQSPQHVLEQFLG